jgi:hypothetical protein
VQLFLDESNFAHSKKRGSARAQRYCTFIISRASIYLFGTHLTARHCLIKRGLDGDDHEYRGYRSTASSIPERPEEMLATAPRRGLRRYRH